MFAEMLSNSEEKIFLEAIDQFFEQDSPIEYNENDEFDYSDIEIEKMSDKFYYSLDEDNREANFFNTNKNNSTQFDSEENSTQNNIFPIKKKLILHDFLIINQENIYNTKLKMIKDYCLKLQMIERTD